MNHFAWQDAYAAFTVGQANLDEVRAYIRTQPEHHRTKTFAEEYRTFLTRHHIQYDERYRWGNVNRRHATGYSDIKKPALKRGSIPH
jgi:hypothetical protein